MANPIRYFPCPACGSPLRMNGSRMVSDSLREQYAKCDNAYCGAGFIIRSEIVFVTSPTSDLFVDNIKDIRPFEDSEKQGLELAIEFLSRQWQNPNTQQIDCVEWLKKHLTISHETATTLTQIAVAELQDSFLSIEKDASIGTNSIVIKDDNGKAHVITLQDLQAVIAQKQTLL